MTKTTIKNKTSLVKAFNSLTNKFYMVRDNEPEFDVIPELFYHKIFSKSEKEPKKVFFIFTKYVPKRVALAECLYFSIEPGYVNEISKLLSAAAKLSYEIPVVTL